MELLQLKYFKEVADCGKIKTAAERLYISPPALSTTISRLEKELGVSLFDRSSNRIELNKQGQILLRHVNQILNSLDYAKAELRQSLEEHTSNLQIVVTTSNLWVGILAEYSAEYPQSKISSSTANVYEILDMDWRSRHSFLFAEKQDAEMTDMDSVWLFDDSPVAVVHPSHPLAERESLKLEELKNETLLLPIAGQSLNLRIRKLFRNAGVPVTVSHECSNLLCEGMVAQNRGIAFSTERTWRLENGLRYIPIRDTHCRWEQRLYWHRERRLSKEEEQFKQFVIRYFGCSPQGVLAP